MDDLNFIKEAYFNPNNTDKDFLDKKNETKSNKELVDSLKEFDQDLKSAINIDVPDNLAQKILFNTLSKKNEKIKKINPLIKYKKQFSTLAASFGILITFSYMHIINGSIESKMLSEIDHHPEFMTNNYNINLTDFNDKMTKYNISFSENIGSIRMINDCKLKGQKGIHFVINGTYSPIVIHYFEKLDTDNESFENDEIKGKIIKTSKGVFIIMSNKLNSHKKIEDEINTFI
jgi:hypothetical protein